MPRPRTVAILQARMGSTRFPGKVLALLGGRPMLEQIIRRVRPARSVDELVVATTGQPEDDAVAALAGHLGVACFRGDVNDVLERFYRAAHRHEAELIIRLTGDNPMVDAAFVDVCVGQYLNASPPCDYLDTMTSGTFAYGLSVEVFSRSVLDEAWRDALAPDEREHVTLFIRKHPHRFRLFHLASERDYSDLNWTVDTEADLERVRSVFATPADD